MARYDDEDDEPRRRRRRRDEEDEDEEAERPRRRRGRRPRSDERSGGVTAVGIVTMILGSLIVLASCGCVVMGALLAGGGVAAGQAIQNQQPQAQNAGNVFAAFGAVGAAVMFVGAVFIFLIGAAYLGSGYGVIRRQPWGRICTLILAALTGLLGLFGLIMNVYTLLFAAHRPPVASILVNLVFAILYIGYAIFSYVVLLSPSAAEEFG